MPGAVWRKASASMSNGQCVEVASGGSGDVLVRDSKNPTGPVLAFPAAAWAEFTDAVKRGEFRP